MATLASGSIILSSVNDAYSVSLSPNSCVITADYNGDNPKLENAYTIIGVQQGEAPVEFAIELIGKSSESIAYSITDIGVSKRLSIIGVGRDLLSGSLEFKVQVGAGFMTTVTFQFAIVRDATTLDWIQDWETNKTKIGETYLITPKIFVGKKVTTTEDLSALSGIYIGPDDINGNVPGIYGYHEGKDVFHINQAGAVIGGWDINQQGIVNNEGTVRLLSTGEIACVKDRRIIWQLSPDGTGHLANGNIYWYADGSAHFSGTLEANGGYIGGWKITSNALKNSHALFTGTPGYLGFSAVTSDAITSAEHIADIQHYGGIYLTYNNTGDYGIRGYNPASVSPDGYEPREVLAVGSRNHIAGWNIDYNSLYIGQKCNTEKSFAPANSVTIGSAGLRGYGWYIDSTGEAAFASGYVQFTHDSGEISGWHIADERLSAKHVALVSDQSLSGVYISSSNLSDTSAVLLPATIAQEGGIILDASSSMAQLIGIDNLGRKRFHLTTMDTSSIAAWNFDHEALYTGRKTMSGFTSSEDITIGAAGLRGPQWRFEKDGSGALAGGKIAWDSSGKVTLDKAVTISWESCTDANGNAINKYLTEIGADGIYTGTISADKITAGTISTADIKSSNGAWFLQQNGQGYLANGNICWDAKGNTSINGTVVAESGRIGGFYIDGQTLTNEALDGKSFNFDACVIFRNDTYGTFAGIGGNVQPAQTSPAVARFENTYSKDTELPNVAMSLKASGAEYNFAFLGAGNGVLNGAVVGYGVEFVLINKHDQIVTTPCKRNTTCVIKPTINSDSAGVVLPSLLQLQRLLGVTADTAFACQYTYVNGGAYSINIYGRTTSVLGIDSTDYPQLATHLNKPYNLSKDKVVIITIVYNPQAETDDLKYIAYFQ